MAAAAVVVIDVERTPDLFNSIKEQVRRCCVDPLVPASLRAGVLLVGQIDLDELRIAGVFTECTAQKYDKLCILNGCRKVKGWCCDSTLYGSYQYDPTLGQPRAVTEDKRLDWENLCNDSRRATGPFSAHARAKMTGAAAKGPAGRDYGATAHVPDWL